jgi:hypothetical protein
MLQTLLRRRVRLLRAPLTLVALEVLWLRSLNGH